MKLKITLTLNLLLLMMVVLFSSLFLIYTYKQINGKVAYEYTLKDSTDIIEPKKIVMGEGVYQFPEEYTAPLYEFEGKEYKVGAVNKGCKSDKSQNCFYGYFKDLDTGVEGISPLSGTVFDKIYVTDEYYILEGTADRTRLDNGDLLQGEYENLYINDINGDVQTNAIVRVYFDKEGNVQKELDFPYDHSLNIHWRIGNFDNGYMLLDSYVSKYDENGNYVEAVEEITLLDNDFQVFNIYVIPDNMDYPYYCEIKCSIYPIPTNYESYDIDENTFYMYLKDKDKQYYKLTFDNNLNLLAQDKIAESELIKSDIQMTDIINGDESNYVEKHNLKVVDEDECIYKDEKYFYMLDLYLEEVKYKIPIDDYDYSGSNFISCYLEEKYNMDLYVILENILDSYTSVKAYLFKKENFKKIVIEERPSHYLGARYKIYEKEITDAEYKEIKNNIKNNIKIENKNGIHVLKYKDKVAYEVDNIIYKDKNLIPSDQRFNITIKDIEILPNKPYYEMNLEEFTGQQIEVNVPKYSEIEPEVASYDKYIYVINNIDNTTNKELYMYNLEGELEEYVEFDSKISGVIEIDGFTHPRMFKYDVPGPEEEGDYDYFDYPDYVKGTNEEEYFDGNDYVLSW